MGAPSRLDWVKLEHELFDRAKQKEAIPDGQPIFTLEDVKAISEEVGREFWRIACETYDNAQKKHNPQKPPPYSTRWIHEKTIHVLRSVLYPAFNSFKQKKGIK